MKMFGYCLKEVIHTYLMSPVGRERESEVEWSRVLWSKSHAAIKCKGVLRQLIKTQGDKVRRFNSPANLNKPLFHSRPVLK